MIDLGMPMSLWPDVYGNGFRARHYLESEGEERVAPLVEAIEAAAASFCTARPAKRSSSRMAW